MSASNGDRFTGLNDPGPGGHWSAEPDDSGDHDDVGHYDHGPQLDTGFADDGYQDATGYRPTPAPTLAAERPPLERPTLERSPLDPPSIELPPPPAPWRRSRRQRSEFVGDVEAAQLRNRLSMAPDRIAEPPPSEPPATASSSAGAWRIGGAAAVVVLGVGGYLWAHASNPAAASHGDIERVAAPGAVLGAANGGPPIAPASFEPRPAAPAEPPPPAIAVRSAAIAPAPDADTSPVAKAAPAAPPRRANAAEIAMMMRQGERFMANSDVSGARLVFQRAAEAGEPAAALALAETYDPVVMGAAGARAGLIPDVGAARGWYEKAKDLGSTIASDRLARLDQFDQ